MRIEPRDHTSRKQPESTAKPKYQKTKTIKKQNKKIDLLNNINKNSNKKVSIFCGTSHDQGVYISSPYFLSCLYTNPTSLDNNHSELEAHIATIDNKHLVFIS